MYSNAASVKSPKSDKPLTHSPERLQWWRARRKLSVRDLADKAGISKSHVSNLENGRTRASAEVLGRLTEALACDDITDLMPALPDGIAS